MNPSISSVREEAETQSRVLQPSLQIKAAHGCRRHESHRKGCRKNRLRSDGSPWWADQSMTLPLEAFTIAPVRVRDPSEARKAATRAMSAAVERRLRSVACSNCDTTCAFETPIVF